MQTHTQHIEKLWNKFLANEATPAELDELFNAMEAPGEKAANWDFITTAFAGEAPGMPGFTAMDEERKIRLVQRWQDKRPESQATVIQRNNHLLWRWGRIAAIIAVLGFSALIWKNTRKQEISSGTAAVKDIEPGKNGAILTLANGTRISLDSAGNGGVVALQNGSQVVLEDGKLAYQANGGNNAEAQYNTIQTPRGRQFQLTLPDGTRVWLNSASSLRYPTIFNGGERRVELTGEGYFEVAKNAAQPFFAIVPGKAAVEVLGTDFNINAYNDAPAVKTTLVQGSVKINNPGLQQPGVILKPGQQAIMNEIAAIKGKAGEQQDIKVISNVDAEKVLAWKNGFFNFEGMSLPEAMHQLERWYDIEVVYENGVPEIPFAGGMTRHVSLNGLLKMLAAADLHFRVENDGKKLIVIK